VAEVFQNQIRERNQFLRGLFGWVGFPSLAVRFRVGRRRAGQTKYSVRRMIRFGVDGVVSFSKTPLQAAVYVGFAFGALGFLYALVTLVHFLLYRSFPSGWTTIIILISIFSGTQLVFLGILGEYVAAIFDEVKARPHYIVAERINFPPAGGEPR
jgi:glycosyltransferase involved in cell wall biosynthesis